MATTKAKSGPPYYLVFNKFYKSSGVNETIFTSKSDDGIDRTVKEQIKLGRTRKCTGVSIYNRYYGMKGSKEVCSISILPKGAKMYRYETMGGNVYLTVRTVKADGSPGKLLVKYLW